MLKRINLSIAFSTTIMLSFSLLLSGCSSIAVADVPDCTPATKQHKKYNVLDKETSAIVAKSAGVDIDEMAVMFIVDRNGKVKPVVPTTKATQEAKRCKFKFPLHAGTIKDMDTLTIFATTNPKLCWRDSSGTDQCIEWEE